MGHFERDNSEHGHITRSHYDFPQEVTKEWRDQKKTGPVRQIWISISGEGVTKTIVSEEVCRRVVDVPTQDPFVTHAAI